MKGCEDVHFKHRAIMEFLIVKKILPIDIHRHMQAVYGINVLMLGCWVWQFKQAEGGEASLCDKAR